MNSSKRVVRMAEQKDVSSIMLILEENLIVNKSEAEKASLEKSGFLIHGFTPAELQVAIQDKTNHIVLVAEEDKQIIGYELSYKLSFLKPDWMADTKIPLAIRKKLASKRVLYHRHIAKKIKYKGIGKLLLQELEKFARTQQYEYIVCQIVHTPIINKASIYFHEQAGYKKIADFYENEIMLGIYSKHLS